MVSVSKYPLPTGTIEQPNFGDIRKRTEFGSTHRSYITWLFCPLCNNGHWVKYANHNAVNTICYSCSQHKKASDETKLKLSISHKGQKPWSKGLTKGTDNRIAKIADSVLGQQRPIMQAHWANPEYRIKTSNAIRTALNKPDIKLKLKGKISWNKGLTKDIDPRIKIPKSAFHKGHVPNNKGVPVSEEVRSKISNAVRTSLKRKEVKNNIIMAGISRRGRLSPKKGCHFRVTNTSKGTIEYPCLGDIRRGDEIGNKVQTRYFIWHACITCGKMKWVEITNNNLPKYEECIHCSTHPKLITNKGTIEFPIIGDIRRSQERGLTSEQQSIWFPCPECAQPRWIHNTGRAKLAICPSCRAKHQLPPTAETIAKIVEKNRIKWDIESLRHLYIDEKLPTITIGKLTGHSKGAVYEALKRNNIPIRSRSEILTDPIIRAKMAVSMNIKPNKPERRLQGILDSLYPNEWKFVGDWKLVIGGLNPDFWNGDHKLIEHFGDFTHSDKTIKGNWKRSDLGRYMHFKSYGYDMLTIWEHELKQPELVIKKITQFVGEKQNGH